MESKLRRLIDFGFPGLNSSFFKVDNNVEPNAPDADTLMILAGPSGSGKSSILRASYQEKLPLFGPDDWASFRKSCKDKSFREYYNYKDVLRKRSFFQTHHVKSLTLGHALPRFVLLHVDLYAVLLGIDPSSYPRSLKIREAWRAFSAKRSGNMLPFSSRRSKRSFASLQIPFENDQIMRAYLQYPFFKRFKRIVVNTVYCDFSVNARQLTGRKIKRSAKTLSPQSRYKYFKAPDLMAQSIHQELYASWERNLSTLNPAAVFATQVSEYGDLLLNGSLLVADWSNRF